MSQGPSDCSPTPGYLIDTSHNVGLMWPAPLVRPYLQGSGRDNIYLQYKLILARLSCPQSSVLRPPSSATRQYDTLSFTARHKPHIKPRWFINQAKRSCPLLNYFLCVLCVNVSVPLCSSDKSLPRCQRCGKFFLHPCFR